MIPTIFFSRPKHASQPCRTRESALHLQCIKMQLTFCTVSCSMFAAPGSRVAKQPVMITAKGIRRLQTVERLSVSSKPQISVCIEQRPSVVLWPQHMGTSWLTRTGVTVCAYISTGHELNVLYNEPYRVPCPLSASSRELNSSCHPRGQQIYLPISIALIACLRHNAPLLSHHTRTDLCIGGQTYSIPASRCSSRKLDLTQPSCEVRTFYN